MVCWIRANEEETDVDDLRLTGQPCTAMLSETSKSSERTQSNEVNRIPLFQGLMNVAGFLFPYIKFIVLLCYSSVCVAVI
jgi:hypothetical protein